MKTFFTLLLLIICQINSWSQEVNKNFHFKKINEEFDMVNDQWEQVNNEDKFYVFQQGSYFLHRKSKKSMDIVLHGSKNDFSDFEISAVMKFLPVDAKNVAAGIIFMAQADSKGALAVQINNKKQYRILKWTGKDFQFLSGESSSSGWVKHKAIYDKEEYNLIRVKCFERRYDLYLNSSFIASFHEPSFKSGGAGLIVEAETKVNVERFSISLLEDDVKEVKVEKPADTLSAQDQILTQVIIQLKTQINQQSKELADIKKQLDACQKAPGKTAQTTDWKKKAERLQVKYDALEKKYTELVQFKEAIRKNENGDLLINLTQVLETEKKKKMDLQIKNEQLMKELEQLKFELNQLKQQ